MAESADISTQEVETLLTDTYKKVLATISKKQLKVGELASIASMSILLVQRMKNLGGNQKKQMVVDIVTMIVEKTDLIAESDKPMANIYIETLLPAAIDELVAAYKDRKNFKLPSCLDCRK